MSHNETIYVVEKFIEESKQYLDLAQEMKMADQQEIEDRSSSTKRRFS